MIISFGVWGGEMILFWKSYLVYGALSRDVWSLSLWTIILVWLKDASIAPAAEGGVYNLVLYIDEIPTT